MLNRKKNIFLKVFQGDVLEMEHFQKNILFLVFLVFLGTVYISFSYNIIKRVKEIDGLEREIHELRSESINLKNKLKKDTRKFKLESQLSEKGIGISIVPPRVIEVNSDTLKSIY
jgi:phage regulator Rha-like protein